MRPADLSASGACIADRPYGMFPQLMTDFSPREIVSELDRFIIGQTDAKRAVAIALRNRWRRLQLDDKLREEVLPKNILMIGPTGVGKTEISRRLARLAGAPFIKVEATKFTEVGYVGRDVEQIVRDLVEVAILLTRERKRKDVAAARRSPPRNAWSTRWSARMQARATKEAFRKKLRAGELNDKEIEIEVQSSRPGHAVVRDPGMPGAQMGAISLGDIFGKGFGGAAAAPGHRAGLARDSGERGIRPARPGAAGAGVDPRGREQRHRVPRRDRQDLRARACMGADYRARRAARPAAADRGHHRL